ncbi:MAG: L-histidine N(alpha)-methyltransferase [Thermoleophilia bacterium]|nr:L-histidine N(alpha)-methyltransferase [Thermoleophilia bacterium]
MTTTTTIQMAVRPWRLDCHVAAGDDQRAVDELRQSLSATPPTISPRWFYDDAGCALFERITGLAEYYQTRTEEALLDARMDAVIEAVHPTELVEIGSGAATKTRAILGAMARADGLHRYIPFDISPGAIARSASALAVAYPGLRVHGIAGDFSRHLGKIPRRQAGGTRLVAFLGSTLGNLEPAQRRSMVRRLARLLAPGDALLMGTDLAHDPAVLMRAYDDAPGVTAEFNRNIIRHINRAFEGDADPDAFVHEAIWNTRASRIEMHLRASRPIDWDLPGLDLRVHVPEGRSIRTEISCKFTLEGVAALYADAGLRLTTWDEDALGRYAISVAVKD